MSWWGWLLTGVGVGLGGFFIIVALFVWWDDNRPPHKMEWPMACPGCGVETTMQYPSSSSRPNAPIGFKYVGHTCEECYHKCMVALGKEW